MYNLRRDDTNELNYKIERLTVSENKFMVAAGEGSGALFLVSDFSKTIHFHFITHTLLGFKVGHIF